MIRRNFLFFKDIFYIYIYIYTKLLSRVREIYYVLDFEREREIFYIIDSKYISFILQFQYFCRISYISI